MGIKQRIDLLISFSFFVLLTGPCYSQTDTLLPGQLLKDGDELVSAFGNFRMGFFSYMSSEDRYLGIWYHRPTDPSDSHWSYGSPKINQPVWVANRNTPIADKSGSLTIDSRDGNLKILRKGGNSIVVSSVQAMGNTSAALYETGNFVLYETNPSGSMERELWQSFDYPTDILLPGMKLGLNLQTGHGWFLRSWTSEDSPAEGEFTLNIDPNVSNQLIIQRRGEVLWTSGLFPHWRALDLDSDFHFSYTLNEKERYFNYSLNGNFTSFPTLQIDSRGSLTVTGALPISCPGSEGCVRLSSCIGYFPDDFELNWARKRGFMSVDGFKFKGSNNTSRDDCATKCLSNCSCIAFAITNENNNTACEIWSRGSKFIEDNNNTDARYISVWEPKVERIMNQKKLLRELGENLSLPSTNGDGKRKGNDHNSMKHGLEIFDFQTISAATNNFSAVNKLGEGGFGPVYKGHLLNGQEVAIKRLSRRSGQGIVEFKNEAKLIAKLQHTNLVRLLGCSLHGEERLLVYEFMPNKNSRRNTLLDWETRFSIIEGIAQGLLYLHKYSRLRVIHRDLKASNILLDDQMNPKISDFGMARIFGLNQSETNTNRVVGTYGYMSPEYAMSGVVSIKTDVFSFGVLVLEIVSGKKNNGCYRTDHPLNLIGYAWQLWNEGKCLELVDIALEGSFSPNEVLRCIHVGLLCVQDQATDRPAMPDVVSMLTNESLSLPAPKQPAFFINITAEEPPVYESNAECCSINNYAQLSFLWLMLLLGSSDSTLTDKLVQGQLLKDGMLLVSAFGNFKLGFFSPASSTTTERYLGIWHDTAPDTLGWYFRPILPRYQTDEPIWIANRNTPILDQSGVLTIDSIDGNLKILHNGGNPIAVSSVEGASNNTSATLLQSGNLVLREMDTDGTIKRVLWQSFDYPTDTLLPGMKLGINLQTGHQWFLQSWLDYSSPAQGSFTLGIEPNATNQLIIRWRGETIYWTSGLLLNGNFNFSRSWNLSFSYTSNEQEKYFEYSLNEGVTSSVFLRIDPEGALSDSRGSFASCTYGGCWNQLPRPICRKGTGPENFQSKVGLISEHGFKFKESDNMSSTDCRAKCFYNCSCVAFATGTSEYTDKQAYCEIWSEGTEFTEIASNNSREIFILAIKEEKWWRSLTIAIGVVLGIPLLCYLCYVTWRKLKAKDNVSLLPTYGKRKSPEKDQSISHELKIFDFQTIAAAANNFSTTNKLGEGGFGPVYKGKLADEQEVAIKRLSRSSGQGIVEFKNEVRLIAKLQHTNLVRLLGCSLHGEERLLVYEFMPNKSLDFFLFNSGRKNILNWEKRFNIIEGISQGLLYLHKYSRLRVIHRDLKASNILLDEKMNPKISDFGMARIFEVNESEANTKRIVGTYGYMSPEYAMSGIVSIKTDVFSFGVLVLEIVSGQKNHTRHHPDRPLNLIGYAWQLLSDGKGLELIDPSLKQSCSVNEVMRCIHVGLLCVQDQAMDRPTMPEVVCMLQNETVPLPPPKQPAFFINANADDQVPEVPDNEVAKFSTNDVTMTTMEAR
ncbi:hypothetical protein CUMW_132360 [Citrus unshiu]|uniref:non-specific serine/threonine protein kinase n=1 Tax=Citrus unshiu TaxID=55188 RepID=A0A2H5PFQ6_CITUN|nr:hypothetical protein CUMW_132360 [Citrus unshiu]